jgi:hypothetical protein
METFASPQPSLPAIGVIRRLGLLCSFVLSAMAGFALTATAFVPNFHSARLIVAMTALILLHLLRFPRLLFVREFALYALFVAYMTVQMLWTENVWLAMNTLEPAVASLAVMILFGSLVTYHNLNAALTGTLAGFLMGAALYTSSTGFPFAYPGGEFGYNVIASMYLFGLILTLILGCLARSSIIYLVIGLVIVLHIVATTSIKNNLGILVGVIGASVIYFRNFTQYLRRHAIALIAVGSMLAYVLITNAALMESLNRGLERVIVGVKILQTRENLSGYGGMEERGIWISDGLAGWSQNPVFGYGVEAFRSHFGVTSHSTPVDLLYNSGLIGFILFYSIFVSIALRLRSAKHLSSAGLFLLLSAALICYLFISLSGVMHYSYSLAAYVAISVVLLRRADSQLFEQSEASIERQS